MSARRPASRSQKLAGALALGLGAAGAAAWALQRRRVKRASCVADAEAQALALPSDVTHRFVEVDDGARIHVVERGEGLPVVLLHGFMLDSTIWAQQFRDLSGTRRVIAVDHRGHGCSELPATGFAAPRSNGSGAAASLADAAAMAEAGVGAPAIRRLASDLANVLETLEVTDALLVGHSMGGMVALQLAQDHPDLVERRISGMVLVSTLAGPFVHLPGWSGVARVAAPASARAVLIADRVGVRSLPSSDLRYWLSRLGFGADAPASQVRFVESLHMATSPRTLAALLPSLAVFDVSASIGSIELRVLVVVGSHDKLTPPRQARRMADALPHAELVELARCGHMPMMERPHEFSHLLEEFAAKTAHA